jgi:hypothetical protein
VTPESLLDGLVELVASQAPPTWNQISEFLKAMQSLRDGRGFAA